MLEARVTEPDPLKSWRDAKASMKRSAFEATHPHAFLVWSPTPAPVRAADAPGAVTAKRVDFHTQVGTLSSFANLARPAADSRPLGVFPLQKAPDNPFADRISVGRAPNCDIVLRDPSVSKLHGHFRDVTLDTAEFTDAKSSNGSRLGGTPVKPGIHVIVKRQDFMTLGRVRLQLLSPGDLYDWL